jgi:predicted nucleic acid-binding protein
MIAAVDASVAVKWYVREVRREAALRLLDAQTTLPVPDILIAEFANIAATQPWSKPALP